MDTQPIPEIDFTSESPETDAQDQRRSEALARASLPARAIHIDEGWKSAYYGDSEDTIPPSHLEFMRTPE